MKPPAPRARSGDPHHELRMAVSGGVEWAPILRTALDVWLPDPMRPMTEDIARTILDLRPAGPGVTIVLRREGDAIEVSVGPVRSSTADGPPAVVRRWPPASAE